MNQQKDDALLNTIKYDIIKNYQCHTIISYGDSGRCSVSV
jgi:hypothetical protein